MSKKIKVIILGIILAFFSFIFIIINGGKYVYKFDVRNKITNINDIIINIYQPKEIVKITNKNLKNGYLYLTIEAKNKGKVIIDLLNKDGETIDIKRIYVHSFNIITFDEYFGDATGDEIIPISIFIFLIYILYLLIKSYKYQLKENLYQYKNVLYLGTIIFISAFSLNQFLTIFNYRGIIYTVNEIISSVNMFSILALPVAFIVFILMIISNLTLIKKEGKNWRNLLGIILGISLCLLTIFPELLNNYLQSSTWINVHNEQGIAAYIQIFAETTTYIIVTYLECILLGTIVIGLKAARHIPKFNKDFIIILGCQIRKDGTLTPLLKARVDRAIEFQKMQKENTDKDLFFIASGGKGSDEIISEGEAIKRYLIECGIKEENILVDDKSKNTYENLKFSYNLAIKKIKKPNLAFSTTNYHVFRAGLIATKLNINIEGIGSKTKSYFWVNAFIREFIGTLFSERKKHIIIFISLIVISILMITIKYLSIIL